MYKESIFVKLGKESWGNEEEFTESHFKELETCIVTL